MQFASKPFKLKFSVSLATLVIALVVGLSGATLWVIHRESTAASLVMSERLFDEIAAKLLDKSHALLDQTAALTAMGASLPSMSVVPTGDGVDHPAMEFFLQALDSNEHLLAVHCAYGGGAYLKVIATRGNPAILSAFDAPADTRYIVQSIIRGKGAIWDEHWQMLGADHAVLGARIPRDTDQDPRSGPWYARARSADGLIFTKPYVLASIKVPGITCARQFAEGLAVFGADITLSRFSQFFWDQQVSAQGSAFLFDRQGRLLAHPKEPAVSVIRKGAEESMWFVRTDQSQRLEVRSVAAYLAASKEATFQGSQTIEMNGRLHLTCLADLGAQWELGQVVAVVAPMDDFTGHVLRMQQRTFVLSAIALSVAILVALLLSNRVSRALAQLAGEADRVQRLDFSESARITSIIREVHTLITAFSMMKTTIRDRTERLILTQNKLETLVDRGISLSSERDVNRLLEMIFLSAIELTHAQGGALFRMDENEKQLQLEIIRKNGESLSLSEKNRPSSGVEPIAVVSGTRPGVKLNNVVLRAVEEQQTLVFAGAEASPDNWLPKALHGQYSAASLLVVPLTTPQGRVKGILALMDGGPAESGSPETFDLRGIGFAEALAAQAAAALDNRDLLASQERLMDAILKVMAGAIDAKSPHTGRHCARVPVVADLLARAAHEQKEGPLSGFHFRSQEDWRGFEIAAWLHDCGKLTTPERVVDKATKLEMVFNRIHEIRTRFEVLWRDAEIEMLLGMLAGTSTEEELRQTLAARQTALQEDFAFVAACNLGSETMTEAQHRRLHKVASQTMIRHFDDRLGLSSRELQRLGAVAELPVREFLLADRQEHLVPHSVAAGSREGAYGFTIKVPQHRFNHGELHNLSIRRGTLTPEERFIIQEHVMQTIIMLDRLPFPCHLAQVPEYAGAHHEHMDGTGYPRGRTGDQMSIPARMMAIADIFEALTACDRSYKQPKPLSEALSIMAEMCEHGHLDPDLFNLFLRSSACLAYAREYLLPEQCDVTEFSEWIL